MGSTLITTPVFRKEATVQAGFFVTAGAGAWTDDAGVSTGVRFQDGWDSVRTCEVRAAVLFNDFLAHAGLESAGVVVVVEEVSDGGVGWSDFLAHAGLDSDAFDLSDANVFGPAVVGSLCFNAAVAHAGLGSVDCLAQDGLETVNDCSGSEAVDCSLVGKVIAREGTGSSESFCN